MTETTECEWCGELFDAADDGHVDDATGLAFCTAMCEDNYARANGLPESYQVATCCEPALRKRELIP